MKRFKIWRYVPGKGDRFMAESRRAEPLPGAGDQQSAPHAAAPERKRSEAAPGESREQAEADLRSVAQFPEENPYPVLRAGRDGSLLYANPAARRWLEGINWHAEQPLPAGIAELVGRAAQEPLAEGESDGADGRTYSFVAVQPPGETYVNLYGRDVTRRKQAEDALRASEEEFRTLANAIPQMCWITDAEGSTSWFNQRWYDYTGATFEQMKGWGWQSVHDPDVFPQVRDWWKRSVAAGEPCEMVFPLRGADGAYRQFLTLVTPVRDGEGKVTRWFGTNTDVTEQRRMEQALFDTNQRLNSLLNALPVGVSF
jgi:PAS domain S-box-containing protein